MKSEIVLNAYGLSSPCLNDILVLVFKNPERYLLKPRECVMQMVSCKYTVIQLRFSLLEGKWELEGIVISLN